MKSAKKFLWIVASGGLVGAILAVWFSPGLIQWYFSPPTDIGITCKEVVPWAIDAYRKVVFAGILLGGIITGILYFAFGGRGGAHPAEPGTVTK